MDREKVIKGLECCTGLGCHHGCEYLNSGCTELLKKDALALLKEQGTVVRCKDCKHYRINTVYPGTNMIMKYCAKTGITESNPDWFCADGERREGR